MKEYSIDNLARLIDHTNLKPYATQEDMKILCNEAKKYHFKMVAINQVQSKVCADFLKDTDINVGAAIAFPLGQTSIESKIFETSDAIKNGATEIDYVINITELKHGNYEYITKEMQAIVEVCRKANVISKVIFENCYLTKDVQIVTGVNLPMLIELVYEEGNIEYLTNFVQQAATDSISITKI